MEVHSCTLRKSATWPLQGGAPTIHDVKPFCLPTRGRGDSCHFQFLHLPDAGNLVGGKYFVNIPQMRLQFLQRFALGPVFGMGIQVAQVPAIGFLPVSERRLLGWDVTQALSGRARMLSNSYRWT
jgi:hypothetical protein